MKPSRVRFAILALITLGVMVNYLDRAIIGIASPAIAQEFALSPVAMGLIFSAFSWSYFAAQIPGGLALDRFGARLVYLVALAGWSLSTLLHATASGFAGLFGWRLSLGVFEAPCFPANNNIVGAWFPRAERARAIGIYTSAEYVALGFATPLLLWLQAAHGWRALFLASGLLGLALVPAWWLIYREPSQHPRVDRGELELIEKGGGRVAPETAQFTPALLWALARQPQIIALCAAQFAAYSTFVFFLTWFPTYLADTRHMTWIKLGLFASLPYLAGFFGILFAGWLSDFLLARGASLNVARKLPVIMGLILASTIVLANYVEQRRAGGGDPVAGLLRPGHVVLGLVGAVRDRPAGHARHGGQPVQRRGQSVRHRHAPGHRRHLSADGLIFLGAGFCRRCDGGWRRSLDFPGRRSQADQARGVIIPTCRRKTASGRSCRTGRSQHRRRSIPSSCAYNAHKLVSAQLAVA